MFPRHLAVRITNALAADSLRSPVLFNSRSGSARRARQAGLRRVRRSLGSWVRSPLVPEPHLALQSHGPPVRRVAPDASRAPCRKVRPDHYASAGFFFGGSQDRKSTRL